MNSHAKTAKTMVANGGHSTLTTRIVIAISLLFCVALCINLNAQATD